MSGLATAFSDTVTTLKGDNASNPSRVVEPYRSNGVVRAAYGSYEMSASNNVVIGMVQVPYRAKILGVTVMHDNLGANTLLDVGIHGLTSGANYDNNSAAFESSLDTSAANKAELPAGGDAIGVIPYEVTDPAGAYVTVKATNGAATGTVDALVKWVAD